ncbi:MAG: glycosyltransferase family 2 protein [Christensenellaceae bacterium]|jgi:cellulose synthase/poly-beta-1,6-N-acetylglucosamine synthase-like glycosyltransferase
MLDVISVLNIAVKVFGAYFVIIMLFAIFKSKPFGQHAPKIKFAVLIAARNEEAVIGNLIKSIHLQEYPADLIDIYVIPNNCTDDTESVARKAGAKIIECQGDVRCKGDALKEAFRVLCNEKHDVYCIFDADNYADKNFLKEMNNVFCDGYTVAKGLNEAKNPYDSWVAGCYGLYFNTMNLFFNKARANIGLSAKPNGTALAFHRSVLEKNGGWNTVTLTEDAEFGADCTILGERIAWVPGAIAYDEEPNSFAVSIRQRQRWISGLMQVSGMKMKKVIKAKHKKRMLRFDGAMILMSPFVQGISAFVVIAYYIGKMSTLNSVQAVGDYAASLLLTVALLYAGVTAIALVIAILSRRYDKRIAKSIFMYGVFMFSWIPISVVALFRKEKTWEHISHGHAKQSALIRGMEQQTEGAE